MTDLLDRSIVHTLEDIVAKTPALGAAPDPGELRTAPPSRRPVLVAAAVVVLAGIGGLVAIGSRSPVRTPVASPSVTPTGATTTEATVAADATAAPTVGGVDTTVPVPLEPAVTLADTNDATLGAPITVAAGSPRVWTRVQPDLDVTWQATIDGGTEFCWRTPVDEQCQDDAALTDPLSIPTGGGQTLLVLFATTDGQDTTDVVLSNGSIVTVPLSAPIADTSMRTARLVVPVGLTIVGSGTATGFDAPDDGVTGATLPPAVDLSEAPITVPAGQPLSYWRFLADLDVAERATADGAELCYRTPAGSGCIDESFESPDVGVVPTDGAVILLIRPALVRIEPAPSDPNAPQFAVGPEPTRVDVTFSDGSSVSIDVHPADGFVAYARVQVPDGATIVSAASA